MDKRTGMKVKIAAGVVLIAAAIAVFWPRPREVPAVAHELPAQQTVGFAAIESPDVWLQALDRAAATLTPAERAQLERFLSTERRTAALGFDPAQAAGWQSAGVDAARGLAVALAAGATGTGGPEAYAWVGEGPPHAQATAQWDWQKVAAWSVAGLAGARKWQAGDGPRLDSDPVVRAAFAGLPTGARASLYAHADGLAAAYAPHLDEKKREGLQYVAQRVRGLSLVVAPERTAGRLVLSSDGVTSLRQIFGDAAPPDRFSAHLPGHGVVAVRVSLNLVELFDGVMAWLPPTWMEARLGVAAGRLGLLATAGLDWTQLERALSGQAVLALDLAAPATPEGAPGWLAMFSVLDAKATDDALQNGVNQLNHRGQRWSQVTVDGHAGWQSETAKLVVVRVDKTCFAAPDAATITRALHQTDAMREEDALDGNVVLGAVFRPGTQVAAGLTGWRALLNGSAPLTLAVMRDPHGLRLEASELPLTTLLRAAAWLLR